MSDGKEQVAKSVIKFAQLFNKGSVKATGSASEFQRATGRLVYQREDGQIVDELGSPIKALPDSLVVPYKKNKEVH